MCACSTYSNVKDDVPLSLLYGFFYSSNVLITFWIGLNFVSRHWITCLSCFIWNLVRKVKRYLLKELQISVIIQNIQRFRNVTISKVTSLPFSPGAVRGCVHKSSGRRARTVTVNTRASTQTSESLRHHDPGPRSVCSTAPGFDLRNLCRVRCLP